MSIKRELLIGIIEEYIKSKEPIGSEFLKSRQNLSISSATIRNYFKVLEKEGALFQPHISSGRIPTNATLYAYWKDVLQYVCQSDVVITAAKLQSLSSHYGIYCIVIPKNDNRLESVINTHGYLILQFSRGETLIQYSEALSRFLESFMLADIHDILKVANEVGAGELKRKIMALLQVDSEEHCFQCGSEYISTIAQNNATQHLNAIQGRTLLSCSNGIYFEGIVSNGHLAIIHDVLYMNAKTQSTYQARMMCIGDLLCDYKSFYAELGCSNFA